MYMRLLSIWFNKLLSDVGEGLLARNKPLRAGGEVGPQFYSEKFTPRGTLRQGI